MYSNDIDDYGEEEIFPGKDDRWYFLKSVTPLLEVLLDSAALLYKEKKRVAGHNRVAALVLPFQIVVEGFQV